MDKLHDENIKIKKIKKPSENLMQAFSVSSSKKKRIPHKSIVIEYSTPENPIIIIWD